MRQGTVLRLWVVLGFGLILALAGCGGGGSGSNSQSSQLRVMHAMPTVFVALDVVEDGSATLFAQDLTYGSATSYQTITAASHTFVADSSGSTNALVTTSLTATAGTSYTLIETGLVGNLNGVLLTDDLTAPSSGDFKIRAVNASPTGVARDVYITAPGADLTTATPNMTNLGFPNASAYMSLTAGSYEVRVTAAGSKSVQVDSGTVTFGPGEIRSLVVLDAPGGGAPYAAILLSD